MYTYDSGTIENEMNSYKMYFTNGFTAIILLIEHTLTWTTI